MDMAQLLRVIVISHKYGFENLRAWSLNVVEQNFWPKSSEFVDSCGGWKNVERLLVICHDCQQYTLSGRIEQLWLDEIKKPDQHGTSEQLETFKAALDAAENHPFLRPFHGKAYYAYLQTCNVFNVTLGTGHLLGQRGYVDHFPLASGGLNDQRSIRLSHGYFSLMRLRSKLSAPPALLISVGMCHEHPSSRDDVWQVGWSFAHKQTELDPAKFLQLQR